MKKNMQRIMGLFMLLVVMNAAAQNAPAKNARRMNVIFFLVDDLGYTDLGYNGSSFYETPHIDSFSRIGVRFNQAYAACHVCSPTRASIISGQYPARLGLTDWLPGRKDFDFQKLQTVTSVQHLPYNSKPLPQVLKDNGYRTAIFGKWHLGEDSNSTQKQGFDVHVPDYNKGWPNGTYFSPYNMKGLEGGPDGEYLTDRITTEALTWVEKNKDQPFFLYLAHYAVHDPLQGRGDLVAKYEKKRNQMAKPSRPPFILEGNPDDAPAPGNAQDNDHQGYRIFSDRTVKIKQNQDNVQFAAMVESMDESFGRVMGKLKELGIEDNTIVIFFSDNGGMSAANFGNPARRIAGDLDKAYSTSNLPFRGGKGWMYEGGIREPLLIYWPKQGQHGVSSEVPVISTDFYSTILDMVGIDPAPRGSNGIDGKSIVPILKGQKAGIEQLKQQPLFWHFPHYSNHGGQSPGGAVRLGDYKLIEYYENNVVQLFNLRNDPAEQHDLQQSEPAKVKELQNLLHNWRKEVHAKMPIPNPKFREGMQWPGTAVKSESDSPYDKKGAGK